MTEKTRYLIIGWSRSGTTITHLAIKGHPNAAALNDEMKIEPFFTKGISSFTHGNDYPEEKQKGYSALFDALTLIRSTDQTTAHGVKIACNSHKIARHLVRVLQENMKDLKVIIIVRKDLVAQIGSALSGKKSGIMHSWYKGYERRKVKQLRISKWRLTSFALNVRKMYDVLRELKKTHDLLEIQYEDLLENPGRFYSTLFNFLNLPAMEPIWIESKKVLPSPENYIKNYHELKKRQAEIENGDLPEYVIYFSRLMGYLYWILRTIMPKRHRKKPFQKQ
ncbi:MAG: hypothetical protein HKM93_13330 [Desulfobacteraceae bacterium]|nr:hypothetical protein [Desulfobacteraceae bacterium]